MDKKDRLMDIVFPCELFERNGCNYKNEVCNIYIGNEAEIIGVIKTNILTREKWNEKERTEEYDVWVDNILKRFSYKDILNLQYMDVMEFEGEKMYVVYSIKKFNIDLA
jgi:hypothetical protein